MSSSRRAIDPALLLVAIDQIARDEWFRAHDPSRCLVCRDEGAAAETPEVIALLGLGRRRRRRGRPISWSV